MSSDDSLIERYCDLEHAQLNHDAPHTILIIHGAFGDSTGWSAIVPELAAYHILLPDLPRHGIAYQIGPFSVTLASDLLSALIKQSAHGGKAKVVGFSLGASIAIDLASRYPEVIDDVVFISGYMGPSSSRRPFLPYASWTSQRVEAAIPKSWIRYLMDGTDMPSANLDRCNLALHQEIFNPPPRDWPAPWPAKTLIVVAGKGGIIPSNDSIDAATRLADIGRKMNSGTRVITHPKMRHPWVVQDPKLFADAVMAWLENGVVLQDRGFRIVV